MANQDEAAGGTITESLPETTVAGAVKTGKKAKTGNFIFDTAQEVESLTKPKALHMAENLANEVEESYFTFGGVLKLIKENSWFDGFADFATYVFEKFGFQERKALYLIDIYVGLVDTQIPWDKVKHLGWTKLKDLVKVPLTMDNLDEWVAKAEALTVAELLAAIKAAKGGDADEGDTSTKTKDDIVTLKFKCHNDQAQVIQQGLAKAKGELHTQFDPVALENVMSAYIGGLFSVQQDAPDIQAILKEMGVQAAVDLFNSAFSEYNMTVDAATPADANEVAG